MSVSYFIVLDTEDVGFDSFVNGKAIAQSLNELAVFCKKSGLKTVEDFYSQDITEFLEDVDEIENLHQVTSWFDAQEGINWVTLLLEKLYEEKPSFMTDALIEDLKEYLNVFNNTKEAGAKWHFGLDF